MFIVGIIAAMATLSVGVATSDKGVEKELRRIEDLLRLASDEAVLQGREYGVTFYSSEYQFSMFDAAADRWLPFEKGSDQFSPRSFPPDAVVDLEIEDRLVQLGEERPAKESRPGQDASGGSARVREAAKPIPPEGNDPQVLILSSGDITPFELRVRASIGSRGFSLRVADSGDMELIRDER